MKIFETETFKALCSFGHLLVIILIRYSSARSIEASKGRDFFVAFLDHRCSETVAIGITDLELRLAISNPNSTAKAEVNIAYYGLTRSSSQGAIPARDTLIEKLPIGLLLITSDIIHSASARVTSSEDVFIQAYMECTGQPDSLYSVGGFAVIPTASLSTTYVAATHCETRNCVILITSVASESNNVSVYVRLTNGGEAQYLGDSYSDGDVIYQLDLETGQSMQVMCDRCDLTGTLIQSTFPVAVVAGGQSTSLLDSESQDLVMEQMVPLESIGQSYLLDESQFQELVKVVPIRSGVTFKVQGRSCFTSTAERQVFLFKRSDGEQTTRIIADDQILVARILDPKVDTRSSDPAMVLAVPDPQWATSYDVFMPTNGVTVYDYVASFRAFSKCYQSRAGNMTTIRCTYYSNPQQFGGLILGQSTKRSWAIPLRSTIPDFVLNSENTGLLIRLCTDSDSAPQLSAQTTFQTTTVRWLKTSAVTASKGNDLKTTNTLSDAMPKSGTQITLRTTTGTQPEYTGLASDIRITKSRPGTDVLTSSTVMQTVMGTAIGGQSEVPAIAAGNISGVAIAGNVSDVDIISRSYLQTTKQTNLFTAGRLNDTMTLKTAVNTIKTAGMETTAAARTSFDSTARVQPDKMRSYIGKKKSQSTTAGIFLSDKYSSPYTVTYRSVSLQTDRSDGSDVATTSGQDDASVIDDDSKTVSVTAKSQNLVTYTSNTVSSWPEPRKHAPGNKNLCRCIKSEAINRTVTAQMKTKMVSEIKSRLLVARQNLSSYTRKKISSSDDRPSATTVGTFVGVSCILFVVTFVVWADLVTLMRCSKVTPAKDQNGLCAQLD